MALIGERKVASKPLPRGKSHVNIHPDAKLTMKGREGLVSRVLAGGIDVLCANAGILPTARIETMAAAIPLKRLGDVADIGNAAYLGKW